MNSMTEVSSSLRYGSRSRFMIELSFEDDPVPRSCGPEERVSWGALKLWVNDVNLCVHYEDGEIRETVNWNWWGLFRWLVDSWDFLFHEQALPVRNAAEWAADAMQSINRPETFERGGKWDNRAEKSADLWFRRHCLWACRKGGLLPNVAFRRFYDRVEVSWTPESPPGAPDHYTFQFAEGGCRLPVAEVVNPIFDFLRHASAFVAASAGTESAEALCRQVKNLEAKERFERRLAILGGFQTKGRLQRFWERLKEEIPSQKVFKEAQRWFQPGTDETLYVSGTCQGALMFGSHAPVLKEGDRLVLAASIAEHTSKASAEDRVSEKVVTLDLGSVTESGAPPWEQGYELADEWAEAVTVPRSDSAVDIEALLGRFGIAVMEIELSDRGTSGVAVASSRKTPLILVNTSRPQHKWSSARRFTLAHELCHLIIDREAGADLAMASGPWAPIGVEKRANAFAAALLMPNDLVAEAYRRAGSHPGSGDFDELRKAARFLGVSADALSQHLCNRAFIDEEIRDGFQSDLESRVFEDAEGENE